MLQDAFANSGNNLCLDNVGQLPHAPRGIYRRSRVNASLQVGQYNSTASCHTYPCVQNRVLDVLSLLGKMGLKVLERAGFGGAVLLEQVSEKHHDVGVRDGGNVGKVGEVGKS